MNGARKFLSHRENFARELLLFPCPFPRSAHAAKRLRTGVIVTSSSAGPQRLVSYRSSAACAVRHSLNSSAELLARQTSAACRACQLRSRAAGSICHMLTELCRGMRTAPDSNPGSRVSTPLAVGCSPEDCCGTPAHRPARLDAQQHAPGGRTAILINAASRSTA